MEGDWTGRRGTGRGERDITERKVEAGTKRDQMERRGIRWNGGLNGTERHQMERRDTRWNGEGPDGTERLEGAERLEETERNQMERRGTS